MERVKFLAGCGIIVWLCIAQYANAAPLSGNGGSTGEVAQMEAPVNPPESNMQVVAVTNPMSMVAAQVPTEGQPATGAACDGSGAPVKSNSLDSKNAAGASSSGKPAKSNKKSGKRGGRKGKHGKRRSGSKKRSGGKKKRSSKKKSGRGKRGHRGKGKGKGKRSGRSGKKVATVKGKSKRHH